VTSLGELTTLEGSRILTFDRVHFHREPLASFASREAIIGWSDGFSELFGVDKNEKTRGKTCGQLVKSHAGGEETLKKIRAAMSLVDQGECACFAARNKSMNDELQDVSVVVLPISFSFMETQCHFLVGFQSLTHDLQGHFNNIRSLYLKSSVVSQPSPALEMLLKWAREEVVAFLSMHPLLRKIGDLVNHPIRNYSHSSQKTFRSKSCSTHQSSPLLSEELQCYADSADQALLAVSEQGYVVGCNSAFCRVVGYNKAELDHRSLQNVMEDLGARPKSEHRGRQVQLKASDLQESPQLMRLSCKDGTQKLVNGVVCKTGRRCSRGSWQQSRNIFVVKFVKGSLVNQVVSTVDEYNASGSLSLVGQTLEGDYCDSGPYCDSCHNSSTITHDSLESMLERGRIVASVTGGLDPEAFRLAQWWEREGAAAFVQAQHPRQRKRAQRLWLERYTAEHTKVRVELARQCLTNIYMRHQFKEEIFGFYYLCRCGSYVHDYKFYPPYSAAMAILDFLGDDICPEMKLPHEHFKSTAVDFDLVHPAIQIRFGVGTLRTDILAAWALEDGLEESESRSNTSSKHEDYNEGLELDETIPDEEMDSLGRVRMQVRQSVHKLLRGKYPA
jgi:PAS domain S-box-containing protein